MKVIATFVLALFVLAPLAAHAFVVAVLISAGVLGGYALGLMHRRLWRWGDEDR